MEETVKSEVAEIAAMDAKGLREKYRSLLGRHAGKLSEAYVRSRLSFLVQGVRTGLALSDSEKGVLEAVAGIDPVLNPELRERRKAGYPRAGKTWSHIYRGVKHVIAADGNGRFVYRQDGKTYASATAVARKITGTHCSGRRFFGIED